MRRTATVTAFAALAIGVAGAPAAADSANVTGGRFAVKSAVYADDDCVEVPVAYDVRGLPDGDSWLADLESSSTGGVFLVSDGTVASNHGTDSALWCPEDHPGAFSLTGTYEVRDSDSDPVTEAAVSLRFSVLTRPTAAYLRTDETTPSIGRSFVTRGCVTAAAHRDPGRRATVEYKRAGRPWRTLRATTTNGTGCWSSRATLTTGGTTLLRVHVPATASRAETWSEDVKVTPSRTRH
jgi:hypothetical protein